jgi:hypothetical protein
VLLFSLPEQCRGPDQATGGRCVVLDELLRAKGDDLEWQYNMRTSVSGVSMILWSTRGYFSGCSQPLRSLDWTIASRIPHDT